MFSEAINGGSKKLFSAILEGSMNNELIAKQRVNEYGKLFKNYSEMKSNTKLFSSYVDNDLQTVQYFNASVTGLAQSFAGFLAIERAIDAPEALLYWLDLVGVSSGNKVLRNIGPEALEEHGNALRIANTLTNADATYSFSTGGKKIVPGTVKFVVTVGGTAVTITDDKKGGLLTVGGVLIAPTVSVNVVNYDAGTISLEFTTAYAATFTTGTDTIVFTSYENQIVEASLNKFKTKMDHVSIDTQPELLIGETDLVSIAAMQKTLGIDPSQVVMAKLTELYTKMINRKMTREIVNNYTGTSSAAIDVSGGGFGDYRSNIDAFSGGLTDVDQDLAVKSYKGCKATAYLVGSDVVKWFRKTKQIGMFVDAPRTYINDLVGYYDGIPVLEHEEVTANEGYAVHRTADGNLAPVGRGMYLPLTNTPSVGNYGNPTQISTGIFYQEASVSIIPELVQKFSITL